MAAIFKMEVGMFIPSTADLGDLCVGIPTQLLLVFIIIIFILFRRDYKKTIRRITLKLCSIVAYDPQ